MRGQEYENRDGETAVENVNIPHEGSGDPFPQCQAGASG